MAQMPKFKERIRKLSPTSVPLIRKENLKVSPTPANLQFTNRQFLQSNIYIYIVLYKFME